MDFRARKLGYQATRGVGNVRSRRHYASSWICLQSELIRRTGFVWARENFIVLLLRRVSRLRERGKCSLVSSLPFELFAFFLRCGEAFKFLWRHLLFLAIFLLIVDFFDSIEDFQLAHKEILALYRHNSMFSRVLRSLAFVLRACVIKSLFITDRAAPKLRWSVQYTQGCSFVQEDAFVLVTDP